MSPDVAAFVGGMAALPFVYWSVMQLRIVVGYARHDWDAEVLDGE